jgi:LPXTG-site transpeptidase (sortase) family protein
MSSKLYLILLLFFIFFCTLTPNPVGEKEENDLLESYKIHIPSISLVSDICVFDRDFCLNFAVWMKYSDARGNILLTGHSFSIIPLRAGVFYSLSDVKVGEKIYIELEETLVYEVSDVYVTSRFDLEVENFDNYENSLVLYSCFPLWTANERIVVRAQLCNFCENEI